MSLRTHMEHDEIIYALREFKWLVEGGVIPEEAARRVGYDLATIERYMYRHNMKEK